MKFIWFCGSGYSFFYGTALLALAILFSTIVKQFRQRLLIYAATVIGVFLIYLSATPLPLWFYVFWTISVFASLIFFALKKHSKSLFPKLLHAFAFCLTITALVIELPFFFMPTMPEQKYDKLYIIGDSVSSGIGGKDEQTWPKLLRDEYGINIIDLSRAGAKVSSAIRQATQVNSENALVLLEIGGNDILAPTPYPQFENELRRILEIVSSTKRIVVMLELPLMPRHVEYGRIQRQLAKQFNVILIPKRFFAGILSAKDATTDLAHLSPIGHQIMAEKICPLLRPYLNSVASEKK